MKDSYIIKIFKDEDCWVAREVSEECHRYLSGCGDSTEEALVWLLEALDMYHEGE